MIKPLRTAVIILCLTALSLTFSLCVTINIVSEKAMEELIRGGTGKTDIMVSSAMGFDEIPVMPEDVYFMPTVQASSFLQLHSIDNYKYIQKKNITVLGVDTDEAVSFSVIPECAQPQNGEIVISCAISQIFGYSSGDEVRVVRKVRNLQVVEFCPGCGLNLEMDFERLVDIDFFRHGVQSRRNEIARIGGERKAKTGCNKTKNREP